MKFQKGTSPLAEKFITAGRAVLYSAKSIPVIKKMITGGKTLEFGAAPFIATTFMHLQAKLGPVQDKRDQLMIVMHLCQDIADIAHELKDPAAANPDRAAHKIFMATAHILAGNHPGTSQPAAPQQPPPQQPPLAQMQPQGGMQ